MVCLWHAVVLGPPIIVTVPIVSLTVIGPMLSEAQGDWDIFGVLQWCDDLLLPTGL